MEICSAIRYDTESLSQRKLTSEYVSAADGVFFSLPLHLRSPSHDAEQAHLPIVVDDKFSQKIIPSAVPSSSSMTATMRARCCSPALTKMKHISKSKAPTGLARHESFGQFRDRVRGAATQPSAPSRQYGPGFAGGVREAATAHTIFRIRRSA